MRDATLMTMRGSDALGLVEHGAIVFEGDRIAWLGADTDLPRTFAAGEVVRADRRLVTPGLVDPHTHLVWGGTRADEWAQRLEGRSYEAIARDGGGILATVRATRAASEADLFATARERLARLIDGGCTTVEIKSGYGLDLRTEARTLRIARALAADSGITVRTTFLGAHAVPPEYAGNADAYVDMLCDEVLPALAADGLVDAVDAFCETVAFTPAQVARIFEAARDSGIPVKLHADQRTDGGGAALAARYAALSADHLEYASDAGLDAMAAAGTVAVVLPGAYYVLRETTKPPVAKLRARGIPIAVATDVNPGTSPLFSPLLAMHLACTLFELTIAEALAGMTLHAARALGLHDRGTLAPGARADAVLWNVARPAELLYGIGASPRAITWCAGKPLNAPP